MNNKKLGNEISVLIDEALKAEEMYHAEFSEDETRENKELYIYLKRLYMSIGMKLVDNKRHENQKKIDKYCEKLGVF